MLLTDKEWLAVAVKDVSRPGILKVKLWKEELFRQDIELPGVSAGSVDDVVLESPFLVVGGRSRSDGRLNGWIKVFQLADDNLLGTLVCDPYKLVCFTLWKMKIERLQCIYQREY